MSNTAENENLTPSSEGETDNTKNVTPGSNSDKIIRNYMLVSLAPAAVPIPIVDLIALTGIQLKMLHSLSNDYGVEFKEQWGRKAIMSLLGGVLPVSLTAATASIVKFIPVVGQASVAVSLATLGAASTYAIGKVFAEHFEKGGTFLDFKANDVKDKFENMFERGKEKAADLKKEKSVNKVESITSEAKVS